jgi:hypothetical protein
MARVQSAGNGAYQLTPGDGMNEPCQISEPVAEPPSIQGGASANVVFKLEVLDTPGLDPASLQVYRTDEFLAKFMDTNRCLWLLSGKQFKRMEKHYERHRRRNQAAGQNLDGAVHKGGDV